MNNDFNNENNYEGNYNYTSKPSQEVIDATGETISSKKKPHRTFMKYVKLLVLAAVVGVAGGAAFQGYNYLADKNNSSNSIGTNMNETNTAKAQENNATDTSKISGNTTNNAVAVETGTNDGKTTSDVSTVVENAMPSIVAINSVMTDVTQDFFGREYSQDVQGSGSGIIIGQNDNEILIATNNHVVGGAKSVSIVFADQSTADATIKGTAPSSDLAVVSVKMNDLKAETLDKIKIATLGDSKNTKLGEMAIAIGNALGYGQSVTVGYVSALNREVTLEDKTMKLLQTDAAINPGNSGGALLNSKGEVIGINSVKYVDSSVESIGYAIPISDAIPIINELMNRTSIDEKDMAYLGIAGNDVTEAYSKGFGMPIGIYVEKVAENSAAQKAGLQVGDIIVSINNTPVKTMADLQESLGFIKAGSTGTITVKSLNNGKYVDRTLDVTFDTKPVNK